MPDLLERLKAALADRYAVESEIGRGGMATVYVAEDLKHRRKVAIKVLHPELSVTLAAERFLSEIQIAAGLNHPHILALFDSGEADGLLYYVMPYVPGESLRHRLEREGQLPVEEAVRIAVEVADGLEYAHEQGVIHRDVKPGNILLSSKHAVITDFGIARAITVAQGARVTSTGLGVGTPLYASPEQATGAETLDGRTDVYSLGCVLYEMLAGEVPLAASTPQAVQARRMSETPGPIHVMRDTVPPLLDQVIGKALARLPADRWESAEKFGQALMTATMDATPVARLDLATTPGLEAAAAAGAPRRRPARWAVAGGVLAVAAVGAWLVVRQTGLVTGGPDRAGRAAPGPAPVEAKLDLEGTFGHLLQWGPGSFAVSPDGEKLAYCSRDEAEDVAQLWLAELNAPDSPHEVLASGTGCGWVRWTPNGDRVLFAGEQQGQQDYYAVDPHGGAVTPFTDCAWANEEFTYSRSMVQLSSDGRSRAFSNQQRKDIRILSSGSCDFAAEDSILVRGNFEFLFLLGWAPRGNRVLLSTNAGSLRSELVLVAADGSKQVKLTSDGGLWPFWWSPDGRGLYYTRNGPLGRSPDVTRGRLQVMRLDLSRSGEPTGEAVPIPWFRDHPVDWFSISEDGRRAVVARETNRYRIVSVTASRESPDAVATLEPLIDAIDGEAWSPFVAPGALGSAADGVDISSDGRWLLGPREVPGGSDLYKVHIEGGEPVRLTRSGHVYGGVWSPDGRYVAYLAPERDAYRVWLAAADGRSGGRVLGAAPNWDFLPAWGEGALLVQRFDLQFEVLDSLVVEYGQETATGWKSVEAKGGAAPTGTFVVRGESEPLVPEARLSEWAPGWSASPDSSVVTGYMLSRPHVSPDGKKVLFRWNRTTGPEPTGSWWWIYSQSEPVHTPLVPRVAGERPVGWTHDGTGLYWQVERDIYLWPLGGERQKLLTLPEGRIGCIPRPEIDTPSFICVQDESYAELFLVENFNSERR